MSVCLCSFRALARSRTAQSKTLAPFLYQTATIQQRHPATRRNASNSSHPSRPEQDIPFENEELPPAIDDAKASRQTTITGSERAAFEKLYKKFNQADQKNLNEHELDQIADEYYEEDDDDNANDNLPETLDSLFDTVLAGQTSTRSLPRRKDKLGLDDLAKQILYPEQEAKKKKQQEELAKKEAYIGKLRRSERDRVKNLLEAAPTDQALWAVLEKEVFSVMRSLELDKNIPSTSHGKLKPKTAARNLSRSSKSSPSAASQPSPTDPIVVFPNYPTHLINAAKTLRSRFPASPLLFNIVPQVKDLGRSSYALGASTGLYKVILIAAFRQTHSYSQICSLLQDMDNGGVEYDYDVVTILDEVLATHRDAIHGHYGWGMKSVLGMDLHSEGAEQLRAWSAAVKRRVGVFGDEQMAKGYTIRRAVNNKASKAKAPIDRIHTAQRIVGGGRRERMMKEEIPLVEDRAEHPEIPVGVEGFLRDVVEADVDAPVEPSIEGSVPDVGTPSAEPKETASSPSDSIEEKGDEKRIV